MRNIKLTIQYDGTNYHGWQTQSNAPSIQELIEDKLSTIVNHKVTLYGSGRTDAGVHAVGQVANFQTSSKLKPDVIKRALNSMLPQDIVVRNSEEVDGKFHARYRARSRVYQYLIWNDRIPSPFFRKFSWFVASRLDLEKMQEAGSLLIGRHDFSSFQGADRMETRAVRDMVRLDIKKIGQLSVVTVEANSFLKHMVRNIVGTLVEVGKGKMNLDGFKKLIEAKDRTKAGLAAPAHGLFLREVKY
jgi:tRNA pseudouridine38-40 synthase